ncbi:nucleotidyltransferase domain-containing protein [Curtobacterium sp. MCSS17_016]|uniref:nucleotidyltransferase domain-containing protein n=1 Tax=Curtobacterium sp. MCSS17_016 TaxID=2175644 RepID=UPI000DAA1E24|nr:nucleotidyltransferase domain-containing protein [Curtobacterium sp. MCSS17_016]WIE80957.1 nucleotidyltransferase domain-containing protein [Curtobacterium sp. MCSS17_016]
MLLQNPFAALMPTIEGEVLAVLARFQRDRPFPLPLIVERTGRSRTGVRRALEHLVQQGIVLFDDIGGLKTYRLNHDHLLAPQVVAISRARNEFLDRLRDACAQMPLRYAAMFGSAARGEMRPDSDIDLIFIADAQHRATVEDRTHDLAMAARMWTGNPVNPIYFSTEDITSSDELLHTIAEEGVPLIEDERWLRKHLRRAAEPLR